MRQNRPTAGFSPDRRRALWRMVLAGGTVLATPSLFGVAALTRQAPFKGVQELLPPDANGVRLPPEFTSRVVARSGQMVPGTGHIWHDAPDGGSIFSTGDGGWIYCCNSEVGGGNGGVSALRFSPAGEILDAYPILSGTSRNCAGGATPWGTWLSCEETSTGSVWECDPAGLAMAVERPAMGTYKHEAVAVDPVGQMLYLTEDRVDGRLYRFTPDSYPDLSSGVLEVVKVDAGSGAVGWLPVPSPNPGAGETQTRYQVAESKPFQGGEGIVYQDEAVFFTTKHDNRVWKLDLVAQSISVIYAYDTHPTPILSGVDNIMSLGGALMVAEDGGDLQLVVITTDNRVLAFAQLPDHTGSEITGPALSPDGSRLYFSSQRGVGGVSSDGMTFEVSGPFERLSEQIYRDSFES